MIYCVPSNVCKQIGCYGIDNHPPKMEMKMCEGYMADDRKITGMMDHFQSFCYIEDTWHTYLALSKSRDPEK